MRYCRTVDFDTLEDSTVTIKDRYTMKQIRIETTKIKLWLSEKIKF